MAAGRVSEAERRLGLPPGAFPFQSRFLDVGGARLHYVDEGAGPLLLMIHGNPSWSYLYRSVILALRGDFRCVALDLAGFGLSTPPPGFSFLPEDHARLTAGLVEALGPGRRDPRRQRLGRPDRPRRRAGDGRADYAALPRQYLRLAGQRRLPLRVVLEAAGRPHRRLSGGALQRLHQRHRAHLDEARQDLASRTSTPCARRSAAFSRPARCRSCPGRSRAAGNGSGAWRPMWRASRGRPISSGRRTTSPSARKSSRTGAAYCRRRRVVRIANCGHLMWMDAPGDCAAALRALKP